MSGHGVSSAPDDIDNSENDDPDGVYKMPVHGENLHAQRVLRTNAAGDSEQQDRQQHDQADSNVEAVQADERIIGGAEKIGGDGETLVVNQVVPFTAGAQEKEAPEEDSEEPGEEEGSALAV